MNTLKPAFSVLLVLTIAGCSGRSDPGQPEPGVRLAGVADLGIIEQDPKLLGRDGGYTARRNGHLIWVFGDTALK